MQNGGEGKTKALWKKIKQAFFSSLAFHYLCSQMYDIHELRKENISRLALRLAGHPDAAFLLRQVEGWQRLSVKVPSWAAVEELHYPHRLALEQCSGEAAASYKAELVKRLFSEEGGTMADLTGGLGVDFSFVAPLFKHAFYVERQEELCNLALHNFPLLGVKNVSVHHGDGVDFLRQMSPVDLLFLDPARRDSAGRKTVLLEDCEPNVVELLPLLLEKSQVCILKLSTMLDLHQALAALQCVAEVHVFAERGECKDLLLVLRKDCNNSQTPAVIYCADDAHRFSFTAEAETAAVPAYTAMLGAYLYEPSAAVLKAGAFKQVAVKYDLKKLHPNSHLYTSDTLHADFPGRVFVVERTCGFGKRELKTFCADTAQANLTVRNFPASVADLRKRLKLREGGNAYWFATTLADESHCLIACRKPEANL